MRTFLACVALLVPLTQRVLAQRGSLEELMAADREFALFSTRHGTRAAFLEFLSDSGVIFRPGPVNGKSAWSSRPDGQGRLSWQPETAGIAGDGRMGWTIGPWQFGDSAGEAPPKGCGHYVSIWAPDSLGGWKVVLDIGVSHRCSTMASSSLQGPSAGREIRGSGETPDDAFSAREEDFRRLADTEGVKAAYATYAADDIHALRSNQMPVGGIQGVLALVGRVRGSVRWKTLGQSLPTSRGLGYVYGEYLRESFTGSPERGHFVRIWTGSGGKWKIAVELENRL